MADRNALNKDVAARLNRVHKLTEVAEEIASLQVQGLVGLDVASENPTPVAEFVDQIDHEIHAAQADLKEAYKDLK